MKITATATIKSINKNFILLLIGFILEFGVFTFFRNEHQYYKLPLIWFTGGILSVIAILLEGNKNKSQEVLLNTQNLKVNLIAIVIGGIYTSYFIYWMCYVNPPNPKSSDVLPTLIIMVKRVLNFEYPYKLVEFEGWGFEPGYLPMQFLPLAIADKLNMDYRYFSFIIMVIAVLIISSWLHKNNIHFIETFIKSILPFYIIMKILKINDVILIHSVELMDAAFVMILSYSIFTKSYMIRSGAIIACLLSRYGIVLWLPLFAFYVYHFESKKQFYKTSGIVIIGIILLYVVPFMTKDPALFFKSIENYNAISVGQWDGVPDWFAPQKPYSLSQGFGFAIYFKDFLEGSTLSKINNIKHVQLILCLILLIAFLWYFLSKKNKIKNTAFVLFASLKLYLIIFYAFIFVPFSYLFLVPLFVSVVAFYKINLFNAHETT